MERQMMENYHHITKGGFGEVHNAFETRQYTKEEMQKITSFLKQGTVCGVGGLLIDIVTGKRFEGKDHVENGVYFKDGFIWEEEEAYHIKTYNAAITEEFYDYLFNNQK